MDIGMPYLLEMDSIESCAAFAKELGLSFVELNANFPDCETSGLVADDLQRISDKYGIYFTLHIEGEADPWSINPVVRAAWHRSIQHQLDLARKLNMPIINMHFPKGDHITLPDRKVYLYERYEERCRAGMVAFRDMCESALSGCRTRISIENTNGWQPFEHRAIEFLLDSFVFGLNLDIGHSHAAGDADEAFFRKHEERLIHMHGHDARGKSNHLALGDGDIDLQERFAWAQRCQARIVLETKTIEALRKSVALLPEFLDEKSKKY